MAPTGSPSRVNLASSSMGPPLPAQPSLLDPPLPIDHALTEPIAAFYKLQFSDEANGFAYYMQTLDVTIGRKVIPPPSRTPPPSIAKPPIEEVEGVEEPTGGAAVANDENKIDLAVDQPPIKPENSETTQAPTGTTSSGPIPMEVDEDTSSKLKTSEVNEINGTSQAAQAASPLPLEAIISHPDDDKPAEVPASNLAPMEVAKEEANGVEVEKPPVVSQVEVDLGALKSVSRLHARIGYSYTLSQFYLEVLGRNGAWVDDVFVMKGSRVGLGPRTKIQISTRIFHFVLPPSSIPNYPIPFSSAASSSSNLYTQPPHPGHQLPTQASLLPLDENQKPATFNAFSNREAWEDERMGLFGIGAGMGPNGSYGYKRKRRRRHHHHEGSSHEDCDHSSDHSPGSSVGDSAEWGSSQYSDSSEEGSGSGGDQRSQRGSGSEEGGSGSGRDDSEENDEEDGEGAERDPAAGRTGRRIALKIINGQANKGKGKGKADPPRIIKLKVKLPIAKPLESEEGEDESDDDEEEDEEEEDEDGDDEDEDGDTAMRPADDDLPPSSWKLDNTPRTAALAAARRAAMKGPQAGKKTLKGKAAAAQDDSDLSPPAPSPTNARGKYAGKGTKSIKAVKAPSVADISAAESSSAVEKAAQSKVAREKAKEEKAAAKAALVEQKRLEKLAQKEAARVEKLKQKQEALDKLKASVVVKPETLPTPPVLVTPPVGVGGPPPQAAVSAPPAPAPAPMESKPFAQPLPPPAPSKPDQFARLPPSMAAAMAAMPPNVPAAASTPTKALTAALQSGGSAPMEIDPIPLISGHTPVSVPIPPTGQPRPPPGPILGLDGKPFIGPEPIKPLLTYAAIIYRALSNVTRGRGTLGGVCDWVAGEWEWFRLNPEAGWQNSIRHNLSLNKAFLKVPRIDTDDPEQKGSVWILDPVHAPEFIAKERRNQEMKDAKAKRDSERYSSSRNDQKVRKTPKPKEPVKPMPATQPVARPGPGGLLPGYSTPLAAGSPQTAANQTFPIVVAPIPQHLRGDTAFNPHYPALDAPPLVVDKGTIILNPSIFSHLTAEHLAHLQSLGTQQCLQILQAYIIQHMKDKMKTQAANKAKAPVAAHPSGPPAPKPIVSAASPAPKPAGVASPVPARPVPQPTLAPLAPPKVASPSVTPAAIAALANGNLVKKPAPTPAPPGSKPPLPAETLRVIAQLAAATGTGAGGNGSITPGASALLQYLQQVGTSADMAVAAQILATGVIPPSAIPANAQAKPLAPPTMVRTGIPPVRPTSGIGGGTAYVARPGTVAPLQVNRLAPGAVPGKVSPSMAPARPVSGSIPPRAPSGVIPPTKAPMGVIPPMKPSPTSMPAKVAVPPAAGSAPVSPAVAPAKIAPVAPQSASAAQAGLRPAPASPAVGIAKLAAAPAALVPAPAQFQPTTPVPSPAALAPSITAPATILGKRPHEGDDASAIEEAAKKQKV